jgi:carboxyl-terminal processing protease
MNAVLQASDRSVKLPTAVLAREYCDGMLDKLDRFSSMIWPSEYTDFRKSTLGRFGGVGIQISKEPGEPLRVVTPLYGSPAFEAGIKAGDLIVAVEGKETNDHDLDKLVNMISGPVGTKVTLRIRRPGVIKPFDVKVERAEIRIKTVKGWRRTNARGDWEYRIDPADRIGYIRLTQFTDKTHEDMVQALRKLRSRGIDSVILDLRFNPGGLLVSAQQVSNEFLKGGLIVKTRGRRQKDQRRADSSGTFLDGNLVVLVNEFSASAAEIVSGALKDWKRCVVVGDRSYGKGSVQNVIPIRYRKAMLKLTTAYYYLPTGRLLHRKNGSKTWGVDPDVEVLMTPKQMRSWLDIRSETDLIVDENRGLDKELAEQFNADMQLKTAVLLVKLQQLQSGDTSVRAVLNDSREDK